MTRLTALALLCLAGATGQAYPAAAQPSTLTIALRQDPDVLDPTLGSSYVGRVVYAAMCDKLIDVDAQLNLVPQLALKWEYEDPTHLVLTLRPGVVFHDNEPLDAEAVKFTLNRALTAKGSMRLGEVNVIESMEVIDPLRLRLVLKQPSASLLSMFADRAGMVLSPKAVRAADAADKPFGSNPVCAGPYAFESRVAQDSIVLKKFPGHWDAANFHFDRVVYRPMPNTAVRVANLLSGSVDLVEQIVASDVAAVRKDSRAKLAIGDGLAYTGINFNIDNGPLAQLPTGQSRLVRQAFELSLDRTIMNQVVYDGLYTPTVQANPPTSPFFIKDLPMPGRDVARAKALLAEAGVPTPVSVTLTVSNEPDVTQVAEIVQAMAAEGGFDVKLKVMEFASSLQAGYAGDFQAYMIGWSGRIDPDGNTWQQLHTGGTFNYGHWSNAEADAALDQAREVSAVADRRALYAKFWQLQRRDMPLMYLWTQKNVVGMRSGLQGFVQVPDGLIRLRGMKRAN